MYRAKSSRERMWWYEPSLDRGRDDIETLGRLGAGDPNGEFEMWFQPAIDLATGRMTGVEALVRWRHPVRGVLAPDAFLDLVGVAGLTRELTSIAIEQATAAMERLRGRILPCRST